MNNLTDEYILQEVVNDFGEHNKKQINEQDSENLHWAIFNWTLVSRLKVNCKNTMQGLNKDKGVICEKGKFFVKLYIFNDIT